jgi:cytoskeletal protein CcmA (bactofilin family)
MNEHSGGKMETNKESSGTFTIPSSASSSGSGTSYLGSGLRIKGDITGNEDLKLDSTVDGLVSIGGFRLTVGPAAHLNANIVAREAVISGQVKGDISACDRIEIKKSASIVGDISTSKIVIEEGAYFSGGVEIGSSTSPIGADLDTLLKGSKKTEQK